MEAFILAAALRVVRTTVNDGDAELEKPYRKSCPSFTRGVSPRRAIVDEERLRQAVVAEGSFQAATYRVAALIGASLQAQVIARGIVYYRQCVIRRAIRSEERRV